MLRDLHDAACGLEEALDRAAASPWALVVVCACGLAWAFVQAVALSHSELQGWSDAILGVATFVGLAMLFAVRREQGRRDPKDDAVPTARRQEP